MLSPARLRTFAEGPAEPRWEALARYTWNAAVCEALYPLLHTLEIVLRNRLDAVAQAAFPVTAYRDVASWLDAVPSVLEAQSGQPAVERAKRHTLGIGWPHTRPGRPLRTHDDLVAALGFGFWTSLFGTFYMYRSRADRRLWPHALAQVFPHGPKLRHPSAVAAPLNDLRRLRNRVFHHEPVWRRDLHADRERILELIAWMSPEAARTVSSFDRLPRVLDADFHRIVRIGIWRESRRR